MIEPPEWLPRLIAWQSADYDGVRGQLPAWMPRFFREKFHTESSIAFHGIEKGLFSLDEIKAHVSRWADDPNYCLVLALMGQHGRLNPAICFESIEFLGTLFIASRLGVVEGLKWLVGDDTAALMNWKQSRGRPRKVQPQIEKRSAGRPREYTDEFLKKMLSLAERYKAKLDPNGNARVTDKAVLTAILRDCAKNMNVSEKRMLGEHLKRYQNVLTRAKRKLQMPDSVAPHLTVVASNQPVSC